MEATTLIESFRVDGKVAVVTGAGSGIGRASALALAGAGAAVVCADINEEGAAATALQIAAAGGTGEGVVLDVSDRDGVDALAERVAAERGGIHIWCNIAGIMVEGPFLEAGEEDLDRILSVNLKGVFFGCQAAGRVMVTQGLDALRRKGVSTAILFVDQSNKNAVALYESLGFKVERDDRILRFTRP